MLLHLTKLGYLWTLNRKSKPKKLRSLHADAREALTSQFIDHVGTSFFQFQGQCQNAYFKEVGHAKRETQKIFRESFDPLERIKNLVRVHCSCDVSFASEKDGLAYFFGVIGEINNGTALHADFARYQDINLEISNIDGQLTWNVYAKCPERGGETAIYDAPWKVARVIGFPALNYPLKHDLVSGAVAFKFRPKAGDVWMFNSRNPHIVNPTYLCQTRLSVAAFLVGLWMIILLFGHDAESR